MFKNKNRPFRKDFNPLYIGSLWGKVSVYDQDSTSHDISIENEFQDFTTEKEKIGPISGLQLVDILAQEQGCKKKSFLRY